jgi:hypothetical protein
MFTTDIAPFPYFFARRFLRLPPDASGCVLVAYFGEETKRKVGNLFRSVIL